MGLLAPFLHYELHHQMPENPELSCESTFTASLGVFILALGASEFVVYLICRSLAWYANIVFYARESLDWIHSDSQEHRTQQEANTEAIAQALRVCEYGPAGMDDKCCPICLIDYDFRDTVAHGNCHHLFHEHCLVQWLQRQSSCPCCRQSIVKSPSPPKRENSHSDLHQQFPPPRWVAFSDTATGDFRFMF